MRKIIKSISVSMLLVCGIWFADAAAYVAASAAQMSDEASAVVDISTYEMEEREWNPGEQITLTLNVKNNSEVTDAKNTVMAFESLDGALTPVYGEDNQIYIGTIPAGQTVPVIVKAAVDGQYKADAVQLKCSFTYVSESDVLHNTVAISIPAHVSGKRLTVSAMVAEHATEGVNALVNIRCKNEGNTAVTDAKLVITGNVQEEHREILLPSIGAGKTMAEDYGVSFVEGGIQSLWLELQYTDEKGNRCTVDCGEYKVKVANRMPAAAYDAGGQEDGASVMTLKLILLGAAVFLAAGITIGYVKKHGCHA